MREQKSSTTTAAAQEEGIKLSSWWWSLLIWTLTICFTHYMVAQHFGGTWLSWNAMTGTPHTHTQAQYVAGFSFEEGGNESWINNLPIQHLNNWSAS